MVGGFVHQQDNPVQRDVTDQHLQLKNTPGICCRKSTKIHQHHVGAADELCYGSLPGGRRTEKFVDAETTVGIGREIDFVQALLQVGGVVDEAEAQSTTQKVEKLP